MNKKNKKKTLVLLFLLFILELIIFSPHVGKGFITDDFIWLNSVVPDGNVDYIRPFTKTTGFFRPMVGLSFAIQFQIHGMDPMPYGFFNLFLHILNIILVYLLLSIHKEFKPYAIWVAVLFALNAKGTNMAVGWISGRTTLLFSFFILLSLYLYLRLPSKHGLRFILTAICYFAALLSKETAIVAPLFVFFFSYIISDEYSKANHFFKRIKKSLNSIVVFFPPLIVYSLIRFNTDAIIPFNAPSYYIYSFSPVLLLKNLSEYVIRAGLLDIYIILLTIVLVFFIVKKPGPRVAINLLAIYIGLLWFLIFLLPLLPIPSRSDLYSYFPQIGLHAITSAIIFPMFKNFEIKNTLKRYIIYTLICLTTLGWIGYQISKAASIGEKGESSTEFTEQVVLTAFKIPPRSRIFIIDTHFDKGVSPSRLVSYGFNSLLKMYYPQKNLSGKIISPTESIEVKNKTGINYFFIWENKELRHVAIDTI